MTSKKHEFKTAIFDDGICAVLRSDTAQPHLMEVIATFYDTARARDYAKFENSQQEEHREETPVSKARASGASAPKARASRAPTVKAKAKAETSAADVSERQQAVLNALRSMMDKKNLVEVRAAELAKASSIPLGSLHSVLASLEKKKMIRTERQGSAKFRAVYEVLGSARKSTRSINGAVHHTDAHSSGTVSR
jgi:DNA-binding MarR family transcriptional regulator